MAAKVGIIGAGHRGIHSFGKLIEKHAEGQVTALCDPNRVRAEAAAEVLGGEYAIYTEVEAMLEAEDLDAVVITSPDYCHAENAVASIAKGANVLLDKPLATTVKGCKAIIDSAKNAGKVAMMGFNLRHDPTLKRLKELIDDGVLGRIFLIENREFYDGGRSYMSRWNRKYELCGGLWIHKGSHDFDVFNWLLDFPKPVKVSATAGLSVFTPENIPFEVEEGKPVGPTCGECAYRKTCPDYFGYEGEKMWAKEAVAEDSYVKDLCIYTSDKDVHDNGISIVEYEGGIRASHLECFVTSQTDRLYTVVGTKGQAEVSLHNRTIVVKPRWSQETVTYQIPEVKGGHGGADPGLVDTFLEVISGKRENSSTIEHGLWSTAIGQAAEIASREERTVTLEELMA
ncbi:MAG: Gfo/Idh/MocA family protein [Planctomycetota bacterium]|jgi:predicted dehydrogenase